MTELQETVTIILPLPNKVLSPNYTCGSIGGRFAKASATKRYRRLAKEAAEAEGIDTAPWQKVRVSVTFFHKVNRKRDEDNAIGSLKAAYDGIIDSGLVPDDDSRHMRREIPAFSIDKEFPRVMIIIERVYE